MLMTGHGEYQLLGRTIDDAAGEAFDKVARLLDLGYPGGPAIQKAAEHGERRGASPCPGPGCAAPWTSASAASRRPCCTWCSAQGHAGGPDAPGPADLAAAFQESVVDVLVEKTIQASQPAAPRRGQPVKQVLLAGGVAANARLRAGDGRGGMPLPVFCPPPALCTDNAVGTAMAGWWRLQRGETSGLDLDVVPSLRLA